ncbi:hypothetical protein HYC85_005575 [Camellia sinensis]|uniref:Ubiquitin fusion degradation protein n=1 Tax=Camellia sinensis TaxID=4442 RepID=A0A7J7HZW8_CAMSI|nr:hypothetical protein HYC85_005575 [Camellia sinensis]
MDNHDSYEQHYFCHHTDMPNLDNGDKIIMPLSSLDRLTSLKIDYPMLLETLNPKTGRVSHCGVLEFTAEEGNIYTPRWMMKNMGLEEGDVVLIKSASLPKGTYIKLQPHKKEFVELSNPKALLEAKLRNFSCLSTSDTIMLMHNNKKFYIDVVQTKPGFVISVIETDCEVDFAIPLDCTEPENQFDRRL